jgi:RimJ/RimL family protein N-acetyltransferase
MTEEITTERLRLRRLCAADAPTLARLIADVDITRWLTSVPWPYTIGDAEDFLQRVEARQSDHFAIEADGAFVGVVSVDEQLGYWLTKPVWGRGYMTEAARAMVNRHFRNGAEDLISGYVIGNGPSANVLTKLGFKPTEIIERYVPTLGAPASLQNVRLDRTGWEAMT